MAQELDVQIKVGDCFESTEGASGLRVVEVRNCNDRIYVYIDYCNHDWINEGFYVVPRIIRLRAKFPISEFRSMFKDWHRISLKQFVKRWNRKGNEQITQFMCGSYPVEFGKK